MPSIDSNDVFADFNYQFEQNYSDAVQLYWSQNPSCEKMEFSPFTVFYNHADNYNVECIVSAWVEQINDLVNDIYDVDWCWDDGTYYVQFNPRPPKAINKLPVSTMGVVDI